MKALSLTQPWASAVAIEIKQWETRSWPTSFRGEVAIHAAKGFPAWAKEFARFSGRDYEDLPSVMEIPLGKIVCIANLVDCQRTENVRGKLSRCEQEWGDYADGRFAFKLENVRVLKAPVAVRGALGFWTVPFDETNEVLQAIGQ